MIISSNLQCQPEQKAANISKFCFIFFPLFMYQYCGHPIKAVKTQKIIFKHIHNDTFVMKSIFRQVPIKLMI